MVSVIPNRGAQIGHQFYEFWKFYCYCRENSIQFYYSFFECNSKGMDIIIGLHNNEIIYNQQSDIMIFDVQKNQKIFYNLIGKQTIKYIDSLSEKYLQSNDRCISNTASIHIRRGDIMDRSRLTPMPEWKHRYIKNEVYIKLIEQVIDDVDVIFLFSNGIEDDFIDVKERFGPKLVMQVDETGFSPNENFKKSMNLMVNSKYFIGGKSGFSFLISLLRGSGNIMPFDFWDKYPIDVQLYNSITGDLI